jgi:ribonucleoside-triphosphate reductase
MYPDYISAKKMRENYQGNVFSCMGCRSFLSPWKDENGNYKFEGRFNQGVVSINLPQIGIVSGGNESEFWKIFDERLKLCYEALMCRHKALEGTLSDVSPIHWQYGAIARLKKGEKIDKLLHGGYSTMSLGYIGLYELTMLMKGVSHTDPVGEEFALRVMHHMKETTDRWKEETGIGFALYGTPAESLCYRFAKIDRQRFGIIKNVTDKGYYTNSYHVDVREKIDAFDKFTFESQFQNISTGGCISYVEIPNITGNLDALKDLVKFIYDNIQYAEFNTKSDFCHVCGFDGEIIVNDENQWECPQCHNKNHSMMTVTRRTCGYLGENFWNQGKTREIKERVLHL